MRIRLASALLIVSAISALALILLPARYPESSPPLRDLSEAADLIVLADVEGVSQDSRTGSQDRTKMPPGTDRVAHLKVREVWKGPALESVDVPFNDFGSWPAPPGYSEGTTVVAFLRHDGREWTTVGMSAGVVRQGSPVELRRQVGEVVGREDPTRVAWIGAALEPGSAGSEVPVPSRDRASHPSQVAKRSSPPARVSLPAQRLEDDVRSLGAQAAAAEMPPEILALLADDPESGVDRAAIAAFETAIEQSKPPAWVRDMLPLLLARLGDSDPDARLAGLGRIVTSEDLERMRLIWREARRDLIETPDRIAGEPKEPTVDGSEALCD